MTDLSVLRRKLARLRRHQLLRRWVCAVAPLGTTALCMLGAVFLLDFRLQLDGLQRTVALAAGLLVLVWAGRRFSWPYLARRETLLDTVLQVERRHGIDSQLVAALQFDRSTASPRGSQELATAVIDDAGRLAEQLDVWRGFRYRPMFGRAAGLLAVAAIAAALAGTLPGHTSAFLRRLIGQPARYPTATVVEQILINGQPVLILDRDGALPREMACAEGEPVEFTVRSSGRAAGQGRLRLSTPDGQTVRTLTLMPANGNAGEDTASYRARLRRLISSLRYQVFLGDTWTDPAELRMIARPQVELVAEVIPPAYTSMPGFRVESTRQFHVPEGSRVRFRLEAVGGKRLREARLSVATTAASTSHQLVPGDRGGYRWLLPAGATPFTAVREELRFEVQVTDRDGLQLEHPLQGVVAVRQDQPPQATISTLHQRVLPQAEPTIAFQLTDDIAVSSAVLLVQVHRSPPDSTPPPSEAALSPSDEKHAEPITLGKTPLFPSQLPLAGQHQLNLARWSLRPGDQLTLALEVTDYRGDEPGVAVRSEPLTLRVSDEQEVLAAISQIDEQSEHQLSRLIERQLMVGGQ